MLEQNPAGHSPEDGPECRAFPVDNDSAYGYYSTVTLDKDADRLPEYRSGTIKVDLTLSNQG